MPSKLFISYAHEDELFKDELMSHLKILERTNVIETWSDRSIKPGEEWNDEIFNNIENSDLFIPLISANFIKSEFCYDKELDFAIKLKAQKKITIIPIIIKACHWSKANFSKYQSLPKNANPISKWKDRDEAYSQITASLEELLKPTIAPDQEEVPNPTPNPGNQQAPTIFGQWILVRQLRYNIDVQQSNERLNFLQNYQFKVFTNNILAFYGRFEIRGNILNMMLANGFTETRTIEISNDMLIIFHPHTHVYSYYRRP